MKQQTIEMKRIPGMVIFLILTGALLGQNNLKADRYLILDALHEKWPQLENHIVPEGEVWKIESAICHYDAEFVSIVINEEPYVIGIYEEKERTPPKLPFFLPSGTEFKLWTSDNEGLVSICVLKIE